MKTKTKKIIGGAVAGALALSTVITSLNPFSADSSAKAEQLVITSRSENASEYVHWAERKFKEEAPDSSLRGFGDEKEQKPEEKKKEDSQKKEEKPDKKQEAPLEQEKKEEKKEEKKSPEGPDIVSPALDTTWVWDDGALLFPTILELNNSTKDSVYCLQYSKNAPNGSELSSPSEDGISLKTYGVLKNGYNQKTGTVLEGLTGDESYWATHAAVIISENWEPDGSQSWTLRDFDLSMDPEADGDAIPVPQKELVEGNVVAKNADKAAKTRTAIENLLTAAEATTEKDYFRLNGSDVKITKSNGNYIVGPYKIETNLKDTPKVELINTPAGSTYTVSEGNVMVTIPETSVAKAAEFSVKVSMATNLFVVEKWQSANSDVQEVAVCSTVPAESVADVTITPEKTGIITLNKVDADGKKLAGVEFTIYDKDNKSVGVITTDKEGVAKSDNLPLGKYTVKETKAADGYALLKTSLEITLTENGSSTVTEVQRTVVNTQTKVVITKKEKDSKNTLEGAKLRVETASGSVVAKGETDRNGELVVKGLAAGKYYIVEEEAPDGYKLAKNKVEFTLNEYGEVSGSTTIENEPLSVTIKKVDANDTNKGLEGATIEIKDRNGKTVYVGKTNSKGEITATKLAPGKYTAQETKAPSGYKLNKDSISFEIENDGDVSGTTTIKDSKTVVTIIKKDKESGAVLAGAKIIIKNDSGTEVFNGTTGSDGKVTVSGLASGRYVYYEAEAPEGYLMTNEKSTFTINKDGEDVELTLYNTKLDISKTNTTTTTTKPNGEVIKTGIEDESPLRSPIAIYLFAGMGACVGIATITILKKMDKKKINKSE